MGDRTVGQYRRAHCVRAAAPTAQHSPLTVRKGTLPSSKRYGLATWPANTCGHKTPGRYVPPTRRKVVGYDCVVCMSIAGCAYSQDLRPDAYKGGTGTPFIFGRPLIPRRAKRWPTPAGAGDAEGLHDAKWADMRGSRTQPQTVERFGNLRQRRAGRGGSASGKLFITEQLYSSVTHLAQGVRKTLVGGRCAGQAPKHHRQCDA